MAPVSFEDRMEEWGLKNSGLVPQSCPGKGEGGSLQAWVREMRQGPLR